MSILQQSAACEKGDSSSGDEKEDDEDAERRRGNSSSPAAVAGKWTAMFEARDRAGTGRATVEVLHGVLEEVKEKQGTPKRLTKIAGDGNREEGGKDN